MESLPDPRRRSVSPAAHRFWRAVRVLECLKARSRTLGNYWRAMVGRPCWTTEERLSYHAEVERLRGLAADLATEAERLCRKLPQPEVANFAAGLAQRVQDTDAILTSIRAELEEDGLL